MKYIYFTAIALFFSISSYSQEELLGEWFLNSITYNGAQLDNYLNISPDSYLNLNFTEIIENEEETLISFHGASSCNPFQGTYKIEGSAFRVINFAVLTGSCIGVIYHRYEEKYISIISNYSENSSDILGYEISGTGTDAILIISQANGNFAVYGKAPIYETIFKKWYLTSINDNGTNTLIPPSESPTLTITTSNDALSRIRFDGVGDCNDFSGYYSIYATDDNALTIFEFNSSVLQCSSTYESMYFNIISNPSTNYLTYELVDEGQTLLLTDLSGRKLYFGSQLVTEVLIGEWFLQSYIVDDVQEFNNETATIDFTTNLADNNGFYVSGQGACNGFSGAYISTSNSAFDMVELFQTLGSCNSMEETIFEYKYFYKILYSTHPTSIQYAITETGTITTLTLTNTTNNNVAIFGRQTVSVSENEFANLNIRLDKNPVKDKLSLVMSQSLGNPFNYAIYSIEGKQVIPNTKLENNIINVDKLDCGMYFLVVSSENNFKQTLKFIKE